jgi:hypothetical protein
LTLTLDLRFCWAIRPPEKLLSQPTVTNLRGAEKRTAHYS